MNSKNNNLLPSYTDYKTDLEEILMILSLLPVQENNSSMAINRVTKEVDELYLQERTRYIKEALEKNPNLRKEFNKTNELCKSDRCDVCPIRKYCNHYILAERNKILNNMPKMVDLFCGAGGLSLGFTQEGFAVVLANDIQECCVDTYAHNHPEIPRKNIFQGDIKVLVDELDSFVGNQKIDVVVGGPPCQGFSMANRQRIIDDPRNHLYKNYVEVVHKLNPEYFVMENVKGMLSVAEQVVEDFKRIGYRVSYKILNAKDFGVPQNRERLIYIGTRLETDCEHIFEEIEKESLKSSKAVLYDALYGLKELKASNNKNSTNTGSEESGSKIMRSSGFVNDYINRINQNRTINITMNHKARFNNERDIEIFGRLNPGDKSNDPKIADIMPYKSRNNIFLDKYFKLENDKVCKTITAHMKFDCNMYIHPEQARGLTPREAARVQSYPDDYYFRGSYTKTYMQIGNSVPPLLGRAIARAIKNTEK